MVILIENSNKMSQNNNAAKQTADNDSEQVITKDLSYSYWTLMPKDKREAQIYFNFKLKEVSELYVYFLPLVGLVALADVAQFNDQRTLFSFFAMLVSLTILATRIVSHCLRHRYPRLYNAHILAFYAIGQMRFAFVAYYKLTQVDESLKKQMAGVLFKSAQELMIANMYGQIVFLSPTFRSCLIATTSYMAIQAFLLVWILSPGDDEYIQSVVNTVIWGIGCKITAHILMHREVRRQITDRKSRLKWQQTVAILDSQSDAIVAIQTSKYDQKSSKEQHTEPKGMLDDHPVVFTNKKSQELFACNLMDGDTESNYEKLNKPCFVLDTTYESSHNLAKKENPLSYASRALIDRANREYFSLKEILLQRNTQSLDQKQQVEVYKMVDTNVDNSNEQQNDKATQRTIIVKRMDFMFADKECQIINITDLTAYTKLKKEEDANRLLKTLNASVHHELLTPVKTMIEISERLVQKLTNFPQEKRMVETMLLSSQLILMHAHDFLDQQLIEHGNFVPYYDTGFLKNAISEIVQMMSFSVIKRDLKIQFDKESLKMSPLLKYDKRRLQQVLVNLLSNACKFQEKGVIIVAAYCTQDNDYNSMEERGLMINIIVQDKGVGMSPEKAATIFEPFGSSNNNVRGNGVGLSICKKICEQLEGSIVVDSKEGVGSKFTFKVKAYQARSVEKQFSTKKSKKKDKKKQPTQALLTIKEEQDEDMMSQTENQELALELADIRDIQESNPTLNQSAEVVVRATNKYTVKFQGTLVHVDMLNEPHFDMRIDQDGPEEYNNLQRLVQFLNENPGQFLAPNKTGQIFVADDQFVNQQGIRLNFEDIGLENRLEMFSNGSEVLNQFHKMFDEYAEQGLPPRDSTEAFQPVRLLLLDINMPIMPGMEVCKEVMLLYKSYNERVIAQGKSDQQILRPVICYLSQYHRSTMLSFMEEDEMADCYLEKPLPVTEMKALMKLLYIEN